VRPRSFAQSALLLRLGHVACSTVLSAPELYAGSVCLTRLTCGEFFECSVRAVRSQSVLQLTGRPRLASLSTLGFLVLGLCELLGRFSLCLALSELLARRMPLSRLTLLELLELLALGEVVEYLSFDELLAGLSLGLGLDGLLGRLALGRGLGGLLGRLALGLGLGGLFGRLALDLDLHSLRQLVRLEFAQGPELLGTMRDGV
jgi:hypothetical protein